jgi:hypothetical protein
MSSWLSEKQVIARNEPDPLDEDFPLGDGTADLDAGVVCPHCGEAVDIAIDPGSGESQTYVEDCPVCCQPWQVRVRYRSDGSAAVDLSLPG